MVLGVFCAVLVVVLFIANLFLRGIGKSAASSSSSSFSESNDHSATTSVPAGESDSAANATATFEKIEFDFQDTMEGRSGFFDLTDFQEGAKRNREELDLVPVTEGRAMSFSGHQIYRSQTNDREYIISGTIAIPVDSKDDYSGNGFLREENTGRLIRVFGNASEATTFLAQYEAGQRILDGDDESEDGQIIIDGCLTSYTFRRTGDKIYINLEEIAPLVSTMTYYDETMGYLTIYVNDFVSVMLPTTSASSSLKASFDVTGDYFRFRSWNGERFECWVPLLDPLTPDIEISYASQMFGWQFYTNGKAISIVTDPLNVSDLTAIRDLGDSGIAVHMETDSDGKKYACAYDSFGNLVWKTEVTEDDYNTQNQDEPIPDEESEPLTS